MDFDDTAEEAAFRQEARSWLGRHARPLAPGAAPTTRSFYEMDDVFLSEGKAWQKALYDGGWAGIDWPARVGGRGGTPMEAVIFAEEENRFDVPQGLFAVALGMAGPTLVAHGTPGQQERYLSAMLRGEEVWCQLFSEPGAGSDLASLSTRAERDGDTWVVNGQKVWSSGAHLADLGILLARTDPSAPKHRGITFFVVDMATEGVEVRPLRQMTGTSSFNEVFLTDVRLPDANVVGRPGEGWRVAMTTLANERNVGVHSSPVPPLARLARETGKATDPVVRQRLAALYARAEVMKYLGYRLQTALSQGRPPGPETSVLKLVFSSLATDAGELAVSLQGMAASVGGAGPAAFWQHQFLAAPSYRIAAGSDEIQRNLIAERVLGLPTEARPDKDLPFSALERPG